MSYRELDQWEIERRQHNARVHRVANAVLYVFGVAITLASIYFAIVAK